MENKVNKNVEKYKKPVKVTVTKDRGDLKRSTTEKPIKMKTVDNDKTRKEFLPDRGDSEKKILTNQKQIQPHDAVVATEKGVDIIKRKMKLCVLDKFQQDREDRKRVREKYTLRSKNFHQNATNLIEQDEHNVVLAIGAVCNVSADRSNKQRNENSQSIEKPHESLRAQRKPIIKTVTLKNDTRLYKAVTFGYEKKSTPLQIKIPDAAQKKQKLSKSTDTSSLKCKIKGNRSKVSIKERSTGRRIDRKRGKEHKKKHFSSPDPSNTKHLSPLTEVAKWAPSCITQHTKPYYEAWVNTRLTAMPKTSDEKNNLEKYTIRDSIQREVERPQTPEMIYEHLFDERYTGRIKVTQRT